MSCFCCFCCSVTEPCLRRRPRKKKRQSGNVDDEDSGQETFDVDMTEANPHTSSAGEEDDPPGGKNRARNQAQAQAKRHEARAKRAETPASSDA
ncbi:hypothetical protein D9758_009241 [Tetrapyrgos nigripes]|uniref:Uncharacterized protein n=1 Tax=Tetrapyrgos nigripes TaxID=182062 RepID=A0A8H5D1Y8_9AGAR|nr:hypothetical protein D9758_009241 [Tetrapyrgos nigripes]